MNIKDAEFHFASAPHRSTDQYTMIVFDSGDAQPPTFDEVARHVERRAEHVRRLRIRICEVPGQLDLPRWVRDRLPVRDHLIDHDLSDGRHTAASFLAELSSDAIDATDRAWTVHVGRGLTAVDGVQGAATVVVVQISHALADGSVGTRIARALFGRDEITENLGFTDDPETSRAHPLYDAAKAAVLLPIRWVRSQFAMVRTQRRYVAAVRTGELVAPRSVGSTSSNVHPDGTRAVHVLQFPKAQFRGGQHTVTVTALTAVGAALSTFFAAHGEPDHDDIRALVPIALAPSVPWPAINRTLPAAVSLHSQLTGAAERASAVAAALSLQRDHVTDHRHVEATLAAENYPAALLHGFGRHASSIVRRTGRPDRAVTHTVVTSVDRTGLDLVLGSGRARLCAGVAALGPGCSLTHAVYGYGEVIAVCVSVCPTTVPDHSEYADILRASIDETCAALHGTTPTAARR